MKYIIAILFCAMAWGQITVTVSETTYNVTGTEMITAMNGYVQGRNSVGNFDLDPNFWRRAVIGQYWGLTGIDPHHIMQVHDDEIFFSISPDTPNELNFTIDFAKESCGAGDREFIYVIILWDPNGTPIPTWYTAEQGWNTDDTIISWFRANISSNLLN